MTIRRTTILIMAGTGLFLLLAIILAGRLILTRGADELEREQVGRDLGRVRDAVVAEARRLEASVADWSTWDATYEFAASADPAYVRENLQPRALQSLGVNLYLLVDPQGRPRHAVAVDLRDGSPLPGLAAAATGPGSPLLGPPPSPEEVRAGVATLPGGVLVVAARPVLRSDGSGPARGTLVFGRVVDRAFAERVSQFTHLEASLEPVAAAAPKGGAPIRTPGGDGVVVEAVDAGRVRGRAILEDIAGAPALVLGVAGPRPFHAQAARGTRWLAIAILAAGVLFGGLGYLLVEVRVLSRLATLSARVRGVGRGEDAGARVAVDGRDEIADLGGEVNAMLGRLERARDALRRAHDGLEARVRERTEELEAANEQLRSVDRVKDALISNVSHELKTPVAKHAMALELLRAEVARRGGDAALSVTLEMMERSVRRQRSVIGNILTLTRLESGALAVRPAPCRVDELLAEVVADHRAALAAHGVAVELDTTPLPVETDRELLWHVFSNLIDNAVKYRGRVGPRVAVSARREGDAVVATVADNGIGIPRASLERVFDRFYQASTAAEGVGLGLHIVRTIVARLGGSVTVDSPGPGLGTTVAVTIPGPPP